MFACLHALLHVCLRLNFLFYHFWRCSARSVLREGALSALVFAWAHGFGWGIDLVQV